MLIGHMCTHFWFSRFQIYLCPTSVVKNLQTQTALLCSLDYCGLNQFFFLFYRVNAKKTTYDNRLVSYLVVGQVK